jgi:hypothetical protein
VQSLSNKELGELITRINLERQLSSLAPTPSEVAVKFISGIVSSVAKQQVSQLANGAAAKKFAAATKK